MCFKCCYCRLSGGLNISELYNYLHELKIDQITDDEEFIEAEHDAAMEYCTARNFNVSDEDMKTIIARALEDSFYNCKEYHIKANEPGNRVY